MERKAAHSSSPASPNGVAHPSPEVPTPAAVAPPNATVRLHKLSALASGADLAARAAASVAVDRRQAFENEFTTVLLALDLDPATNWNIDFVSGAITLAPPPGPASPPAAPAPSGNGTHPAG